MEEVTRYTIGDMRRLGVEFESYLGPEVSSFCETSLEKSAVGSFGKFRQYMLADKVLVYPQFLILSIKTVLFTCAC